jgi:hypothetical protein
VSSIAYILLAHNSSKRKENSEANRLTRVNRAVPSKRQVVVTYNSSYLGRLNCKSCILHGERTDGDIDHPKSVPVTIAA